MVSPRDVRDLLDERPDLEPGLEAILEPAEPWTFEDVDIDSGRFGELVARGVVEETGGGYRVADRAAVEAALAGDVEATSSNREFSLPAIDDWNVFGSVSQREMGLLLAALALVFLFRTIFSYPRVFPSEHVVLSGNDPYFYRYWVELLLTDSETTMANLPGTVLLGEPLMVVSLWLVTRLFGGAPESAGLVLAWYPVISALITAVMVYAIAILVTEDKRIGLASVAMLAVLPGHALRTSLGFADHHAFDYPWLVLTLLGVVLVATAAHRAHSVDLGTIVGTLAIAIGVTGQVLAWEAGPLLIAPLGVYLALESIRAVQCGDSPLPTTGPILVGVLIAAGLTWFVHETLGWHTTLVASAPALLAVGGIGVVVTGAIAHRTNIPGIVLAAVEGIGFLVGVWLLSTRWPELWARLTTSLEGRLLARRDIAEVQSLFADSGGWLLLFGLLLLLALPYLAWATHRAREDARWLPLATYGWAFFVLAVIQVRFVGELSPIIAIFAGLGFVHVASWIDAAQQPAPFTDDEPPSLAVPRGRQLRVLVVLFLLVTSLSIIQVPVKTGQVTIPPERYEATTWMVEYNESQNLEYPQNYVFSDWGHSRTYNYFVNGEARSYGYAQSNWVDFVTSQNGTAWYERIRDRVGFIVVNAGDVSNPNAIGTRLHEDYGSATSNSSGLAHYRARYVAGEFKVFTLTEGAVITGTAGANKTVEATTQVEIPGAAFEYTQRTTANESGAYRIHVPYPGTYEVGDTTVEVPAEAVENGSVVEA